MTTDLFGLRASHRSPLPSLPKPKRILFVFAWLVVGGEETEVRLLARHLNPQRYQIEIIPCFRKPGMTEQTHEQLAALGVRIDKTPYTLSYDETVAYLAKKIPEYDVVVACQAVQDIFHALAQVALPPPLIEHGGLVCEAVRWPKQYTTRYVGVCKTIRNAAAALMPERPHHALEIPSMVDLSEFRPTDRLAVRAEWRVAEEIPVIGWAGRLDRKKRVEDFIQAAALLHHTHPLARFMIIGGPDSFMPEYAHELRRLTYQLGLQRNVHFLGDRPDVPRLLAGLDIFVWLSKGEGMPHVINEAGAAGLPVIATRDNGSEEQIEDNFTGLFVPHNAPTRVAVALDRLIRNPLLRRVLGANLRRKVEREFSAAVVTRRWEALFDEVIEEYALLQEAGANRPKRRRRAKRLAALPVG